MALAVNSKVELLGPFTAKDAGVDYLRLRKTIYLPSPYVGMFLKR